MKYILIFFLIYFPFLFSQDIVSSDCNAIETSLPSYICKQRLPGPELEFVDPPDSIMFTYYDYMPGGYKRSSVLKQAEISSPYNNPAGGIYILFMAQESIQGLRDVYYYYLSPEGVDFNGLISYNGVRRGFINGALDPETCNPFAAWHDSDNCMMSYDIFNVIGESGYWVDDFIVIDNPETSEPLTGHDNDRFIWPQLRIGPSPLADYRRIHLYAENANEYFSNILYGYADIRYQENYGSMEITPWTFQTFPELDYWAYNEIKIPRSDLTVSDDGQIALVGFARDSLFVYHSTDYGASFDFTIENAHWNVWSPFPEWDMFIYPSHDGGHFNAVFGESRIFFLSATGMNDEETFNEGLYFPALFYPKLFYYDLDQEDFGIVDIQIPGRFPYDDNPMIPYDLNENGIEDSLDSDGNIVFVNSWPTLYFNGYYQEGSFHYSKFQMAKNDEYGWLVGLFQDGRKLKNAYFEVPGYEDWAQTPEIVVVASNDGGQTWSYASYLNAKSDDENYYQELEGMLPCYVYLGAEIEYLEEDMGLVRLFFLDDFEYGQDYSLFFGGVLYYASMKIDFNFEPMGYEVGIEDKIISSDLKLSNFPNPFNPYTLITYQLKKSANVKLNIYNIKGQLVRALVNERQSAGRHEIFWDGKDQHGNEVSSGVYLYRLEADKRYTIKKMMLVK